jgi:hypothetical protein
MPIVTGTIQDESEALYVGHVIFENRDSPGPAGTRVNGPATTSILTGTDGALPANTRLAPGRTRMQVNGRWSKYFTVPEGAGTYDLATLMAASTLYTRAVVFASTIANLREYQSSSTNFMAFVTSDANGQFSLFRWEAEDDDADDGVTHIRPDDFEDAGIWVKIL